MNIAQHLKAQFSGKNIARIALSLSILGICIYFLTPHLTKSSLAGFPAQLASIHWSAWCAAFALTTLSLWSVGRYDAVAHKHFATRIPQHQARASGTIAIALAQTLGFGMFTGAVARWRMLPAVSLGTAFKLSAFVSASFMICWGIVTAFLCIILPAPNWTFLPSLIIAFTTPVALCIMFRWPTIRLKNQKFHVPNLQNSTAILFWTIIDTTAMAAVLYMLLPIGADIQFSVFLPLFLLALGSALLSNTPGGVGPFELVLLGLLPQLPVADVLCSIIAFRFVYYAVPAFIALLALTKPFQSNTAMSPSINKHIISQPEAQIITQNGGSILNTTNGTCAIWPTAQTVTSLCNPLSGSMAATLNALKIEATLHGKLPFVYKCNRQSAAVLRQDNWQILHMSDDAIVAPQAFDLDRPAMRSLRRKLRNAQKAGLTIKTHGPQPWADLKRIDQEWQTAHGKARGGTMGRFEVGYLSTHVIVHAKMDGQICAFITFQTGPKEWCLDVMRHANNIPDGTMHALVHTAINLAKIAGVKRLSLAAIPACPDPNSRFFRWAARKAVIKAGGTGLRQFKSSFAPAWEPRYAAAPSKLALIIGLADITREVHSPNPIDQKLSMPHTDPTVKINETHNIDEYYELASKRAS